jgi:hypothetical protein
MTQYSFDSDLDTANIGLSYNIQHEPGSPALSTYPTISLLCIYLSKAYMVITCPPVHG